MTNPFRYFKRSPEIIRLAVMLYVRFPLSLRNVEGAVTLSNRSRVNLAGKFGSRRGRHGLPGTHSLVAKLP